MTFMMSTTLTFAQNTRVDLDKKMIQINQTMSIYNALQANKCTDSQVKKLNKSLERRQRKNQSIDELANELSSKYEKALTKRNKKVAKIIRSERKLKRLHKKTEAITIDALKEQLEESISVSPKAQANEYRDNILSHASAEQYFEVLKDRVQKCGSVAEVENSRKIASFFPFDLISILIFVGMFMSVALLIIAIGLMFSGMALLGAGLAIIAIPGTILTMLTI